MIHFYTHFYVMICILISFEQYVSYLLVAKLKEQIFLGPNFFGQVNIIWLMPLMPELVHNIDPVLDFINYLDIFQKKKKANFMPNSTMYRHKNCRISS